MSPRSRFIAASAFLALLAAASAEAQRGEPRLRSPSRVLTIPRGRLDVRIPRSMLVEPRLRFNAEPFRLQTLERARDRMERARGRQLAGLERMRERQLETIQRARVRHFELRDGALRRQLEVRERALERAREQLFRARPFLYSRRWRTI